MNEEVASPRACSDQSLTASMDGCHRLACEAQHNLLAFIAEADRRELWKGDGARDMAHWLWMRYGVSDWKARRWIIAAHALSFLPLISEAFASGVLGIDKVVELCRFATPETEENLVRWAQGVSSGRIRQEGDLAMKTPDKEVADNDRDRHLSWWYEEDGRRFGLSASLPAAQGAVVARALQRVAEKLPVMPGEAHGHVDQRRADALVALCSARIAGDPDPDRATVVVHARLETLVSGEGGSEIEGGGVIPAQSVRRLLCTGRVQTVIEDEAGEPLHVGRMRREPPAWMVRQLRYRDHGCRFPGCGSRRFTHAHHVVWWDKGGATDLGNLVLVCGHHHRLVHEHGWRLNREQNGEVRWFRPDGTGYRAGPGPPRSRVTPEWAVRDSNPRRAD